MVPIFVSLKLADCFKNENRVKKNVSKNTRSLETGLKNEQSNNLKTGDILITSLQENV
jgi:hypothetical protein